MLRGAFFSGAGMFLSMGAAMGVRMMFTRILSESEAGVYLLLILSCDLFILVTNLGVRSALPKLVAGADPAERPRLVSAAFGWQWVLSGAVGVAIIAAWLCVRDPRAFSTNESWIGLYPYLGLLPLYFFVGTQRDMAMAAMAGLNRYAARAGGLIAASLAHLMLVAVLVWWLRKGLLALMLATLISYTVAAMWQHAGLPEGRRPRLLWRPYREIIAFSWPLYLNNVLAFALYRFDTMIVAGLLAPVYVAHYEMAKSLPLLISGLLTAALVPYLPGISQRIAKSDMDGAARLASQSAILTGLLSYAVTLGLLVVQRPLIVFLFSEKYLPCLPVLWILLAGFSLGVQAGVMGQTLVALDKPIAVCVINIGAAVLSIGLNLVFIPRFGIVGAAYAYLVAVVFGLVLQTAYVVRYGLRIDLRRFLAMQLYAAAALAIGLVVQSPVGYAAGLGGFAGLCLLTRVVAPSQIRQMLIAFLPSRGPAATP